MGTRPGSTLSHSFALAEFIYSGLNWIEWNSASLPYFLSFFLLDWRDEWLSSFFLRIDQPTILESYSLFLLPFPFRCRFKFEFNSGGEELFVIFNFYFDSVVFFFSNSKAATIGTGNGETFYGGHNWINRKVFFSVLLDRQPSPLSSFFCYYSLWHHHWP